jgi:PTH1 family peptidyl-tRNA hydrolase
VKLIVGLGNPGPRYRNTRHNVGFEVVDCLAARWRAEFNRERHRALMAEASVQGSKVILLKPLTFMNRSGETLRSALDYTETALQDVLVIVDDVNLPLGRLRLRTEGSAGGHNGLRSIISHVGTEEFPRLRLGVGAQQQGGDLAGHVLSTFRAEERPELLKAIERAADAVETWLAQGMATAMNTYN